jgi:hypothetical protein
MRDILGISGKEVRVGIMSSLLGKKCGIDQKTTKDGVAAKAKNHSGLDAS